MSSDQELFPKLSSTWNRAPLPLPKPFGHYEAVTFSPSPLVIIGAYASASGAISSPADEEEWYGLLDTLPAVDGLELPFSGTLHAEGIPRLASLLHSDWRNVVATIPSVMGLLASNPRAGLASDDEEGRAQAVASMRALFDEVAELKALLGEESVFAIEISAGPRKTADVASSTASLVRSLEEISSWGWGDTILTLEHNDAAIAGQEPQKGFLSLAEETDAARAITPALGQVINWGRSAIEGRSAETPAEHVRELVATGTLTGLMFSGACDHDGIWGPAWVDAHAPLRSSDDPADSLLTPEHIENCLRAASTAPALRYIGVKVQGSGPTATLAERTQTLRVTLETVLASAAAVGLRG